MRNAHPSCSEGDGSCGASPGCNGFHCRCCGAIKYQVTCPTTSRAAALVLVADRPGGSATGHSQGRIANNSVAPHVLVAVGGLPAGITEEQFIDLLDAFYAGTPPPAGVFDAGAVFSKPGQDHQKQFDLTTPGQYGFFCPIPSPEGVPHYKEGFVGLFKVVAP